MSSNQMDTNTQDIEKKLGVPCIQVLDWDDCVCQEM